MNEHEEENVMFSKRMIRSPKKKEKGKIFWFSKEYTQKIYYVVKNLFLFPSAAIPSIGSTGGPGCVTCVQRARVQK